MLLLDDAGGCVESETSRFFPWLPMDEFARRIPTDDTMALTGSILQFHEWVHKNLRAD